LFRPIAVIYKKNKVLSPAMKQFINTLKGDTVAAAPVPAKLDRAA